MMVGNNHIPVRFVFFAATSVISAFFTSSLLLSPSFRCYPRQPHALSVIPAKAGIHKEPP
jgi:hypothetical protein